MEQLYPYVVTVHSVLRWVVLIAGLAAAGKALAGWLGKHPWVKLDDQLGMFMTVNMDVQLVVGLLLYFVFSPLTRAGFAGFASAMSDPVLRFFLVEHLSVMLVAVVLTHMGRALSRRASGEAAKHQRAAIFYTLAMLAVLISIPWPFQVFGRPLNPFHLFFGG
jgi:hypothetical protein